MIKDESKLIINNKVFILVIIYAFLSLINQTYQVVNSFNNNAIYNDLDIISLSFFIIQTILMIFITINLAKCLVNVYPSSKKIIVLGITVWYLKISLNIIKEVFTLLKLSNQYNSLFNNLTITLNLLLLTIGIILIIVNKIPKIGYFLLLVINQIILSLFKLIVESDSVTDNVISLISMSLKLIIITYILNIYRKHEIT